MAIACIESDGQRLDSRNSTTKEQYACDSTLSGTNQQIDHTNRGQGDGKFSVDNRFISNLFVESNVKIAIFCGVPFFNWKIF